MVSTGVRAQGKTEGMDDLWNRENLPEAIPRFGGLWHWAGLVCTDWQGRGGGGGGTLPHLYCSTVHTHTVTANCTADFL